VLAVEHRLSTCAVFTQGFDVRLKQLVALVFDHDVISVAGIPPHIATQLGGREDWACKRAGGGVGQTWLVGGRLCHVPAENFE
jgi:hypothetical protein